MQKNRPLFWIRPGYEAILEAGFLARRMREDGAGVGARVSRAIMDDVDSMCLVRECRELEKRLGVGFTDEILPGGGGGGGMVGMREVKETVRKWTGSIWWGDARTRLIGLR